MFISVTDWYEYDSDDENDGDLSDISEKIKRMQNIREKDIRGFRNKSRKKDEDKARIRGYFLSF